MVCARALTSLARAAGLVALPVVLGGCDTTSEQLGVGETATAIVVSPQAFLGAIPCSGVPGAMQSYVATLIDHTDPSLPFVLASSNPLPCSQQAQFRFVVPGHLYTAEIDGYEQPASALVPRGGHGSGNRRMKLATGDREEDNLRWPTLEDASARWSLACNERTAQDGASLTMSGCQLLADQGTTAITAIELDVAATRGELRCTDADGTGDIDTFDVLPEAPGLPGVVGIACATATPVRFEDDITPGAVYPFRIEARGPSGVYGASCQAIAAAQRTVFATCAPLSAGGALSFPADEILAVSGLTCGADGFLSYIVGLTSLATTPTVDPFDSNAVPCRESARFAPLPPGPYEGAVYRPGASSAEAIAVCQGEVIPGATTIATCTAAP